MKALKIAAITSVAVVVVMLLMLGYLFLTAEVTVTVTNAQTVSAKDSLSFAEHKEALNESTFIGTIYQTPSSWRDASEYAYTTYTVHVKNGCLVPIEMIEIQVVPRPADIAQIGFLQDASLKAKSEGDLTATILTSDGSTSIREMIVSYYVWGTSFQVRTVAGQ